MVIHEKYDSVDRLEELFPLSLQILRFKMVAMRRKAYRHGEPSQVSVDDLPLSADDPDPEQILARKEMLEGLAAAIATLGQRCKEIFRLKLEGHSFPEIRDRMGAASLNTIYTWDHRCRKELLARMGGRWEALPGGTLKPLPQGRWKPFPQGRWKPLPQGRWKR